ncbi:CdaR family transcriptional regulator [Nocardioides sp. J9]|uniref:PucR family transcriptional regulator n=1 Tax=Nocardioides sp. J9 TaxID=935844 RepID=UPI0011A0FCB7|nr:helix-turn-helix domain-containing protein [Nocardioides sp. J9]
MSRSRTSLSRVLEDLGATLLELCCGDPDDVDQITNVVIHDPLDDSPLPRQALVLGVGISEPADVVSLLEEIGPQGAVGLVLRAPVAVDDRVLDAVAEASVPVLGLTPGASWSQLTALLRSLVAEGDVGDTSAETLGGLPSGDLFALANAIATLIDASITIEDRSSRVLAFSDEHGVSDAQRVESILGRHVPDRFTRLLEERKVFEELYRSRGPIEVPPLPYDDTETTLPRVALAVRAGDEVLGSIWAVVREPLSPERTRALQESAKLVSLHLLRLRAGADVERRLRAELVATALEGGPGALEAVDRLGLAHHGYLVLALDLAQDAPRSPEASDDALRSAESRAQRTENRQRVADAFAMHLSAVYPHSATAVVNDVVYGIVNIRGDDHAVDRAEQVVNEFLDRIGKEHRLLVGVGSPAQTRSDLTRSRAAADRVLRVLRAGRVARRVASMDQVHVQALLLELADLGADRDEATGPLARLLAYDAERGSNLVETLSAWLDAFGDVSAASAAVFTHQSTFRYRLRKVAEVGGIDLGDPEARFDAMVQLRLLDINRSR